MIKEFCDRCGKEVRWASFDNKEKVELKLNMGSIVLCTKCFEVFNQVFMANAFITTDHTDGVTPKAAVHEFQTK